MTSKYYIEQLDEGWIIRDETEDCESHTIAVSKADSSTLLDEVLKKEMKYAFDEALLPACEVEITIKAVPSRLEKNK